MPNRLLDRQASLLAYLTSGAAIFGKENAAPLDQALRGFDPTLLRIEARFSYDKRMEKITSIFPRTVEMLGDRGGQVFQDFVDACPPSDVERFANARQFHEFLLARWRREAPHSPYLPDVAAFEAACAHVRNAFHERDAAVQIWNMIARVRAIRRRPDIRLLRCRYDIRPIFESGSEIVPVERDTRLAITMLPTASEPRVFEVLPAVFDLLTALEDWTDPAAFGITRGLDELIRDLAGHGLLEVRV